MSTIGTELSHETIFKIVDSVADEVLAWQQRPLEALYPVMYLDAVIVKVRDGGHVRNKAAHIAVGSTPTASNTCWGSGSKPPREPSSGRRCAPSWPTGASVTCSSCAGLTGFPEAVAATWPEATVQTCVVHLIRASMRFVNYADRKAVAAALKPI